MKRRLFCAALLAALFAASSDFRVVGHAAQRRAAQRRERPSRICHDPTVACRTSTEFLPHDLRFELPPRAVIWETQEFYAVILKSVRARDDLDCDTFVPEDERLAAQELFPRRKVFTSRCNEPVSVYYTNAAPGQRFMAVYAGATRAEAEKILAAVRATGKFPGANLRRMRAGFNGT
ncbi:MAG TPA: hypothetical protein VK421_18695 [Pyrinomonadaceae bacterium]|nr:hypothetical protein [Pyrinomonadaceae bacterium]